MTIRKHRRGATIIEYGLVAVLLGITVISLSSVGTDLEENLTIAPCMSDGGSGDECGMARTGATCKDGTSSGATGRGACSRHGGVKEWTY
jgi:Flp pilus assembly pilin Flp